jgi:hypothetical protein
MNRTVTRFYAQWSKVEQQRLHDKSGLRAFVTSGSFMAPLSAYRTLTTLIGAGLSPTLRRSIASSARTLRIKGDV